MKYLKTFESKYSVSDEQRAEFARKNEDRIATDISIIKSIYPMVEIVKENGMVDARLSWDDFIAYPKAFFAGNAFETREEAMKMVEDMRQLGATDIIVGGLPINYGWSENEIRNRMSGDALYFEAPEESYRDLMSLCQPDEHRDDQGKQEGTIRFWWD